MCLAAATATQTEVSQASEYANISTLFGTMSMEIRENREQTARLHVLMDELATCGVLSVSPRDDAENDGVEHVHDTHASQQPSAICGARSEDELQPVHRIPSGVRVTFAEPLEAAEEAATAADRERSSSTKGARARTMGASTGTTDRKATGTTRNPNPNPGKGKVGKVKAGTPANTTKRLQVGQAAAAAAATLATRPRGASFPEAELAHSRTRRLRLLYKELAELDASL